MLYTTVFTLKKLSDICRHIPINACTIAKFAWIIKATVALKDLGTKDPMKQHSNTDSD